MTNHQAHEQDDFSNQAGVARWLHGELREHPPAALQASRHPELVAQVMSSVERVLTLMAEGSTLEAAWRQVETETPTKHDGQEAHVLDRDDVAELRLLALESVAHHRGMQESIRRGRDRFLGRAKDREEAARWVEKTLAHHADVEQASVAQLERYDAMLASGATCWRCQPVAA